MLLPFPSPSILQPLIEQHPPLYPTVSPPRCLRKGRSSPIPLIFATVHIFPTNHQSQAVCPHTLGMGRHPRQPQGRDFPPGTLTGPPGSLPPPPRAGSARRGCVCRAAGSSCHQGPSPRVEGIHWVPAPGATRRAMPLRMMAPLGEARHRVFFSH